MLVGKSSYSLQQYPKFFALFAAIYVIEPLLTRVYIKNMCAAGEKVRCTYCSHPYVLCLGHHIMGCGLSHRLYNKLLYQSAADSADWAETWIRYRNR